MYGTDRTAEALASFYRDILYALEGLVDQGGTAVGAAQVIRRVAKEHGVPNARDTLPVPTRQTRERLARERRSTK